MGGDSLKPNNKLFLKLVQKPVALVSAAPVSNYRTIILAGVCFFLLKFPMLFVTHHPEELRDFDHYVRTSQNDRAFRDYVYAYGPLAPLVYGNLFKLAPHTLVAMRFISLCFWTVGAIFIALILARCLRSTPAIFVGTLVASNQFGYSTYTHNHVLAAVGILGACYFLLKFLEERSRAPLVVSFFLILVCLFTRPVIMGYGVFAVWWGLMLWAHRRNKREGFKLAVFFIGVTVLLTLLFFKFHGPALKTAFLTPPWLMLPSAPYPNLHFLVPQFTLRGTASFELFLKEIRAALETGLFYTHYFIWPAILLTLVYAFRYDVRLRSAMVCVLLSVTGSVDILHYGFDNPLFHQAMTSRGPFFFGLTSLSLILVLWPKIAGFKRAWVPATCSLGVLAAITVWGYMPWVIGVYHLSKFSINPYSFPALRGIASHRDRESILQAIHFVNGMCSARDRILIPYYQPGLQQILRCEQVLRKDLYAFTRPPWYVLEHHDSPYAPEGGITNGELNQKWIRELNPRFYILPLGDPPAPCPSSEWKFKDFGMGNLGNRVCWRKAA